jgi:hypothetical protein
VLATPVDAEVCPDADILQSTFRTEALILVNIHL